MESLWAEAKRHGLCTVRYPIRDRFIPHSFRLFVELIEFVTQRLEEGRSVCMCVCVCVCVSVREKKRAKRQSECAFSYSCECCVCACICIVFNYLSPHWSFSPHPLTPSLLDLLLPTETLLSTAMAAKGVRLWCVCAHSYDSDVGGGRRYR